jgi:RHS repeat-associated protein
MKLYHITALVASFTGSAMAAMPTVLPEFKDEKQLATWRAEQQSAQASTAATAEAMAFYTGKPYLASAGGYAFKYRNYKPELARWTSEDPSGFPDGANNNLYVNNMTLNSIDLLGLDIYQITNTNAVAGGGHTAMLSGSGSNYQIQSYGSGTSGSGMSSQSSSPGLSIQNFSSQSAAMSAARSQGYNQQNHWNTTPSQDSAARNAFSSNANSGNYQLATHNCANAVTAGLGAANVNHTTDTNVPNLLHVANSREADDTGIINVTE